MSTEKPNLLERIMNPLHEKWENEKIISDTPFVEKPIPEYPDISPDTVYKLLNIALIVAACGVLLLLVFA